MFGAGLRTCGLGVGDKVLVWMPNGPLALAVLVWNNMIGAVFVAINTSYKGKLLEHVIENSGAATMVCHPDLADRLLELPKTSQLRTVFTTPEKTQRDAPGFAAAGFDLRSWDSLLNCAPDLSLPVQGLKPWTLQSVCYTSGTTGPSKGVMSSYLHLHTMGFECTAGTDASDRWLINLTLFHAGGTLFVAGAFSRGSSIALLGSFETTSFLRRSRELGATACVLLGAMASFLLRQPPNDGDRDHLLRRVMILPLNADLRLFRERFGFDVYTVFNMSEISCPIRSDDNPSERGSCGKLRPGVEGRIVDEHDCEVAVGDVGELVLRADCPWTMSHGYLENRKRPHRHGATAGFTPVTVFAGTTMETIFLSTGSRMRSGAEERTSLPLKSNSEVMNHPSVLEAAAVGVPSEFGEEDVLIAVVQNPEAAVTGENLLHHLLRDCPIS